MSAVAAAGPVAVGGGFSKEAMDAYFKETIDSRFKEHDLRYSVLAKELVAMQSQRTIFNIVQNSTLAYKDQAEKTLAAVNNRYERLEKESLLTAGSGLKILAKVGIHAGAGVAKRVAETAAVATAKQLGQKITKRAVKEAGEAASKRMLKRIPVISLVCGVILGAGRLYAGDHWTLAVAEVASGVAGCFPGPGTAASLAIDGALLVIDISSAADAATTEISAPRFAAVIENMREAYECLGIRWEEGEVEPDRLVVDTNYRNIALQYHPDKAVPMGIEIVQQFQNLTTCLNGARDMIYQSRGWR